MTLPCDTPRTPHTHDNRNMCYHRLYIFSICGHSLYAPTPLLLCKDSAIPPDAPASAACTPRAHPFQSLRIHRLCALCDRRRSALLAEVERDREIKFDQWRWKVAYQNPAAEQEAWKRWGSGCQDVAERFRRRETERSARMEGDVEVAWGER